MIRPEPLLHDVRRHWLTIIIALYFVALGLTQESQLLLRLDALCHDGKTQAVPEHNNHGRDGSIIAIVNNVVYKGFVDLRRVDGKTLQIVETRIPCTKVIDGKTQADPPPISRTPG